MMRAGLPPMRLTASRCGEIDYAGTPVKSWSKTRAGMKAISFALRWDPGGEKANVFGVNEAAIFTAQKIFQQDAKGKRQFASVLMPCFSSFRGDESSKDCAPTLSLSRVPKELPAGMAIHCPFV